MACVIAVWSTWALLFAACIQCRLGVLGLWSSSIHNVVFLLQIHLPGLSEGRHDCDMDMLLEFSRLVLNGILLTGDEIVSDNVALEAGSVAFYTAQSVIIGTAYMRPEMHIFAGEIQKGLLSEGPCLI